MWNAHNQRLVTEVFADHCPSNCIAPAGTLPAAYAGLSSLAATALLLSGNNLTGGIPFEWGQRGLGMWNDLRLTNNSRMCGQVPEWFYTQFGAATPSSPVAMLNGECTDGITATCLPRQWPAESCRSASN
jgi:hypothetical protein